ncbi:MAG: aspartate ammonia-lyase [Deltaproteobacteria bacterium]|jgi:aspartate ammonia-lyase|nr:aspartate ammonia-lyase [Deltaproteobacteria bacterium]
MRRERDLLGEVFLPEEALYGAQTQRARENFGTDAPPTNLLLIYAIVKVKKAAALTYLKLLPESQELFQAIVHACDMVLSGAYDSQFPVPALQGGAGTSTNMNVNEVLSNLAIISLGGRPGDYHLVSPLDDVNRGQSTNDVYPTALRIAAVELLRVLADEAASLQESLQEKENAFAEVRKLGRTELMDAVPITLGEEFGAFAQAVARDRWRLYKMEERLRQVNIGGAAVGLSTLGERKYRFGVIERLRELTGLGLSSSEYPMDITQNNDVFVEVSGLLKSMAVNLIKIGNDLRLMNSGPHGGLGEIRLSPMQMGSTIMPGKVNPVIPEYVALCSMKVVANDLAITFAASRGELELNAFMPLIAEALLESLEILGKATRTMRKKCVETLEAAPESCLEHLNKSFAFAASYVKTLGYLRVAEIIKDNPHDPKMAADLMEKESKALSRGPSEGDEKK